MSITANAVKPVGQVPSGCGRAFGRPDWEDRNKYKVERNPKFQELLDEVQEMIRQKA